MMNIELVKVREQDKVVLANLIELFEYEFSAFNDADVNEYGLYGYTYLDHYWTESNRHAYFIKVNNVLAGFVMVNGFTYVSKEPDCLFLAEFFVLKKYRQKKVGQHVAHKIWDMFPSLWEFTVHPKNEGSIIFWESVLARANIPYKKIEHVEGVYDDSLAIAYLFDTRKFHK